MASRTPEANLYRWAKYRAKKHNLSFDISREDIIIPKVCPILGISLHPGKGHAWIYSPTIDRIDNSVGYTHGNVWVISNLANQMKSCAEPLDLVMFAKWIINRYV